MRPSSILRTLPVFVLSALAMWGQLPDLDLSQKRPFPRPIPCRLNDQGTSTVWFVGGTADPVGLDGLYNPMLDLLVRRDTSVLRSFGATAYGSRGRPTPRAAGTVAPRPTSPLANAPTADALEGTLLRRSFVSSLGDWLDMGVVDLGDSVPRPLAERRAALLALTGATGVLVNPSQAEDRKELAQRTLPPVESFGVDAFPKTHLPTVVVRHMASGGLKHAVVLCLGGDQPSTASIPLAHLGLAPAAHAVADLFNHVAWATDAIALHCDVPAHGARLLVMTERRATPVLMTFGTHLAGGFDFIKGAAIAYSGQELAITVTADPPTAASCPLIVDVPGVGPVTVVIPSSSEKRTELRWSGKVPKPIPTAPTGGPAPAVPAKNPLLAHDFTVTPWADAFREGQSVRGTTLELLGARLVGGFGGTTGTSVAVNLGRKYKRFSAIFGGRTASEVRVRILIDGVLRTEVSTSSGMPSALLDVELTDAGVMTLEFSTVKPGALPEDVALGNIVFSP